MNLKAKKIRSRRSERRSEARSISGGIDLPDAAAVAPATAAPTVPGVVTPPPLPAGRKVLPVLRQRLTPTLCLLSPPCLLCQSLRQATQEKL